MPSTKSDPATWARIGDTIRVTRLKPYNREFDYVVESVDPTGFAVNRSDCADGAECYYGEYPGDYAVVSRAPVADKAPDLRAALEKCEAALSAAIDAIGRPVPNIWNVAQREARRALGGAK